MRQRRRISPQRLSVVLTIEDIMAVLGVGASTAKAMFSIEGFPKLDVMKRSLVLKDSFFKWMERREQDETNKH